MQKNKKLKTGTEKSKFLKNIVVIIFIFLTISLLFTFVTKQEQKIVEIPLSMVANKINAGEVEKIEVEQKKLIITTRIGTVYHSRQELNVALSESLVGLGANPEKLAEVIVTIKEIPDHSLFHFLLILFLPLIILGIFFFYIIKQAKGGMNQAFDFSKMQAKVLANKSQL